MTNYYHSSYSELRANYDRLKARSTEIEALLLSKEIRARELKSRIKGLEDTKSVLNQAIKLTNETFKTKLETIATSAIQRIFKRPIRLVVEYAVRSYGIETKLLIMENDNILDPESDMGGSIIEVISIVLRIVLWQMSSDNIRNVIILDEPFRWAGKLIDLIGQILVELSESLNLQFIIVTHDDSLVDIANRVIQIERQGTTSKIVVIR